MHTKKLTRAIAGVTMTLALSFASSAAFAAVDFDSAAWPNVGGVNYDMDSDGSGNTYGGFGHITTAAQANFSLNFTGVVLTGGVLGDINDYYGFCYGDTATETTESNGDVVISCPAYEWGSTGIWYSQEFRMYNDQQLARQIFTLENRGATPVDIGTNLNGFYFGLMASNKQASSTDSSSCANLTADDNWVMGSNTSDSTITGLAWQAKGSTRLSGAGVDCGDSFQVVTMAKSSLAPGEKLNLMMFTATAAPAGTTSGDMDAAFATLMTSMSSFDSLNDTLCRGIDGLAVEGWGTCVATLPNTGSDSFVMGATATGGAALLAVGALAIVVMRRRVARN